jgi:hypothetical protein
MILKEIFPLDGFLFVWDMLELNQNTGVSRLDGRERASP